MKPKKRSQTPLIGKQSTISTIQDEDTSRRSLGMQQNFRMAQLDGYYEGSLGKNYKKNGNGIMLFDDGLCYVGQWFNDSYHGEALLCLPFGSLFLGTFYKNDIIGPGLLYLKNVRLMLANFDNGVINGTCFELNILYNFWLVSQYERGVFQRYIDEFHVSKEDQDMKKAPLQLERYEELHKVYDKFMNQTFKFVGFDEEILDEKKFKEKKIQIISDELNDQWYIGFTDGSAPSGLGMLLYNYTVQTVGVHSEKELNNIVVDHKDPKRIYHSIYQNGVISGELYSLLPSSDGQQIECQRYNAVKKKNEPCPIKTMYREKTEIHKKSPYYYFRKQELPNSVRFQFFYELDKTFFLNTQNHSVSLINNYIYFNLFKEIKEDKDQDFIKFKLENLVQLKKDGFTQKPQTLQIIQYDKSRENQQTDNVDLTFEQAKNKLRNDAVKTQKEIEEYEELLKKLKQERLKSKIPIFSDISPERSQGRLAKAKPSIFKNSHISRNNLIQRNMSTSTFRGSNRNY